MSRRIRVIPTLLIGSDGGLIKTIKFRKRIYIGDPINAVKIFNEKYVDELILIDIDASLEKRAPKFELIEDIVSEAFIPVAYGGGVTSVEEIATLFRCGVEKVILSSAAIKSPNIIREASERFGSQSIVVCLDVNTSMFRKKQIYTHNAKIKVNMSPSDAAKKFVEYGAGELMVYSIDRDGSYNGYDIDTLKSVSSVVNVPIIACGGARNLDDFLDAIKNGDCSAVAAGSMFVFQGPQRGILLSYPSEIELQEKIFSSL